MDDGICDVWLRDVDLPHASCGFIALTSGNDVVLLVDGDGLTGEHGFVVHVVI